MSKWSVLIWLFLHMCNAMGIECIDNNARHLYFLDSGAIYQYGLSGFEFHNKKKVAEDTAFVQAFYQHKRQEDRDFNRVKRRLSIANYLNLICYGDKVYVTARYVSLDSNWKGGWEYVMIEYSEDLKFLNLFILKKCSGPGYGRVEVYPRFRLMLNDQHEVILPIAVPMILKNKKDSADEFAVFRMDAKRSELRFSRALRIKIYSPRMKTIVVFNYPKNLLTYPLNIPIMFSEKPAYFSFPYVIVNNFENEET